MKDKEFKVVIEKEKFKLKKDRNLSIGIKSNINAHSSFTPLMTREELSLIAIEIIKFLEEEK